MQTRLDEQARSAEGDTSPRIVDNLCLEASMGRGELI